MGGAPKRNVKSRRFQSFLAGSYIAIQNSSCARKECQVTSKKTGACYQKCHVYVNKSTCGQVLIQYMNNERADEWSEHNDARIIVEKDEKWCKHGKICNRMVRQRK